MTTTTMDWDRALGARLTRHSLAGEPGKDPVETVGRICGVQAQVASCAEQAVAVRTAGVAPEDVRRAVRDDRSLVKTWAMRGTLHLLPAEELPLWCAALSTKPLRWTPAWERYHGVTAAQAEAVSAAVPELLRGRALTRDEIAAELADRHGPGLAEAVRSGWGTLLKPSAYAGELCFGPDRGRNVTFVSPRDWLDVPWRRPDPDEAMRTVLWRFLDAYGPATLDDFARWWGVEPKDVRPLFARHADELVPVELDGVRKAWLTKEGADAVESADPAAGVRLLPGFDPYVLAPLSTRHALLAPELRPLVSRTAGWISAVLLVAGRIAGTWTSEKRKGGVTLTVTPFAPLPARVRKALAAEADRYAPLLGGPVALRVVAG